MTTIQSEARWALARRCGGLRFRRSASRPHPWLEPAIRGAARHRVHRGPDDRL